jgi:hypothetical protein
LELFPENMGAVSNEHGERLHQDIPQIEKRQRVKVKQSRYRPRVAQRVPGS